MYIQIEAPEYKFPNSKRLISVNNDNSNDVSRLSSMINIKESDITIVFQITQNNADIVHNAVPKQQLTYNQDFNTAIFSEKEITLIDIKDKLQKLNIKYQKEDEQIQKEKIPILVFKEGNFTYIASDITMYHSDIKKQIVDFIEQLYNELNQEQPTLVILSCNISLKHPTIMNCHMNRIIKDGNGSTYEKEEYDHIFAQEEKIMVLRHYVIQDKDLKCKRHRPMLIEWIKSK